MNKIVRLLAASALTVTAAFVLTGCCCGFPLIQGGQGIGDLAKTRLEPKAEIAAR